jgi:tetratricopeptide (TPR) repeat protein
LAIVAAASVVVGLGFVGLAISNILVKREKERVVREKERGDRHLARAKKVVEDYLANTAEDRRLKAAGLFELRKSLLLSMVAFLEELATAEGDDKTSRIDRAWAQTRLAHIFSEVGEHNKAIAHHDLARSIWAGLAADFPNEPGARVFLAECDNDRGVVFLDMRQTDEAERWLRQSLEAREQLAREYPTIAARHRDVGATLNNLATIERNRGNREGMKKLLEQAIVQQQSAVAVDPHDQTARRFLANHQNNLGVVLMELKQFADSAKAHEAARSIFAELAKDYPNEPEYRARVAGSHHQLGQLQLRQGNAAKAIAELRRAAAELEPVTVELPGVPDYRRQLAQIYHDLGTLLYMNGKEKESKDPLDRGLKLREQLFGEYPKWVDVAAEYGVSLIKRGADLADDGEFEAALPPFTRAVQVLEPLAKHDPSLPGAGRLFRNAAGARADVLMRLGRPAEALTEYDKVLALRTVENREYFRIQRSLALAHLKKHVEAAAEAADVAGGKDVPAFLLEDAAAVHALCSAAVRDDAKLSEQYAAKAVAVLRQAFEKNYEAIAAGIKSDKNLDALRSRPDYQTLMKEWEERSKGKKKES